MDAKLEAFLTDMRMREEERSVAPCVSPALLHPAASQISCFRAFYLIAFLLTIGIEAVPKQLIQLHVVFGGVGFESSTKSCRDTEIQGD